MQTVGIFSDHDTKKRFPAHFVHWKTLHRKKPDPEWFDLYRISEKVMTDPYDGYHEMFRNYEASFFHHESDSDASESEPETPKTNIDANEKIHEQLNPEDLSKILFKERKKLNMLSQMNKLGGFRPLSPPKRQQNRHQSSSSEVVSSSRDVPENIDQLVADEYGSNLPFMMI